MNDVTVLDHSAGPLSSGLQIFHDKLIQIWLPELSYNSALVGPHFRLDVNFQMGHLWEKLKGCTNISYGRVHLGHIFQKNLQYDF